MTSRLKLVKESAKARMYEQADGSRQWVPKSVCKSTLKFPAVEGGDEIHEVEIFDWWLAKNPWPSAKQTKLNL